MRKPLTLAIALAALSGCTVGPNYVRPEQALPAQFDQAEAPQQAAVGTAVWQAFNDPALDALLARTVRANQQIAQARARLNETRALAGLSVYSLFPTVTAGTSAERSRFSNDDPFAPSGLGVTENYRAGFDASWELDLFGFLRNPSRAIRARSVAREADLRSMQISMVAETAQAYFALRGARQRLALVEEHLQGADEVLRLVTLLTEHGRLSPLDQARAQTQRDQLAAERPQRQADVVMHEQRLAVLTAQPVAKVRTTVGEGAGLPALPALVTVGTPEAWLQRRPDILAAERELAAAYNDVGEEMAQFFPRLLLTGGFGWTGQAAGALGDDAAERWSWGPALSWRFLDIGRVRQMTRAAQARADASEAQYRETVLRALEETENALAGYRASNEAATHFGSAAGAAREAARIARARFDAGADDAITLLQTEQERIRAEDAAVQAEVTRATALAALYKAVAGDFAQAQPSE